MFLFKPNLLSAADGELLWTYSITNNDNFPIATGYATTTTDWVHLIEGRFPIAANELELRGALLTGGQITFSNNGTIFLTAPLEVRKDTVISGTNFTIAIDGQSSNRLFHVFPGVRLEISNLTLQNGVHLSSAPTQDNDGEPALGGAVFNEGELIVNSSLIKQCLARARDGDSRLGAPEKFGGTGRGGAIFNVGRLAVSHSTIQDCTALGGVSFHQSGRSPSSGGAIYNNGGAMVFENAHFLRNTAGTNYVPEGSYSPVAAARGGAIASTSGTNRFEDCVFQGNRAIGEGESFGVPPGDRTTSGGAVYIQTGVSTFTNCFFDGNSLRAGNGMDKGADTFGGAIFNSGAIVLAGCSFVTNSATAGLGTSPAGAQHGLAAGGAVFNLGDLSAINTTFFQNVAVCPPPPPQGLGLNDPSTARGGALYNQGTAAMTNCTVAENIVDSTDLPQQGIVGVREGANIYTTNQAVILKNTILSGGTGSTNATGSFIDAGNNISSDSSPAWTQTSSKSDTDPKFGVPGFYGGNHLVLPIATNGPAVDAGETLADVTGDQRGHARPFGTAADVGAFELSPPYTLVGFIKAQYTVTNLSVTIGTNDFPQGTTNRFELSGLDPNIYRVRLAAPETIFSPREQSLSVQTDGTLFIDAYRSNAFTAEIIGATPVITFAGASNTLYRIEETTDWTAWRTLLETKSASELIRIPGAALTNQFQFYRAIRP